MPILQQNGTQYKITLPKDVVKSVGWKKGDNIHVSKDFGKDFLYLIKED